MEPNTNPLGNPGPTSGMPPSVPPSNNSPQGISTPAGAAPVISANMQQSQALDTTSVPGASNVSNTSMGMGDSFGGMALPGTGNAPMGDNGAFTAPETAPVDTMQVGTSDIAAPIPPSNDPINTAFANSAPGVLHGDAALPPSPLNNTGTAAPIGHPTNIDGINQVRVPDTPGGQAIPGQPNAFVGADNRQTPSVSFNDPAVEPGASLGVSTVAQVPQPQKKKSNKTVLIILSVVAFIVAVGLAVVLVMEVTGTGFFATNNNGGSDKEKIEPQSGNGGGEITGSGANGTNSTNGTSEAEGNGNNTGNGGTGNGGNTGNNNGAGNGSGSSVASGGQISDNMISCSATSSTGSDGTTMTVEMILNISDNKIDSITTNTTTINNEGHIQSFSQTNTFEEMSGYGTSEQLGGYVETDGTLNVSPQELADYLQTSLSTGGDAITCTVQ